MSKVLVLAGPREVAYEEVPDAPLAPDEVRIRTLFSGISAGTELAQYRGTSPFLHKRWDAERRLFLPGEEASVTYPLRTWGYEEVGEVVEVGAEVDDIEVGALLFGTWGHRTHHVATAEYVRPRLMPAGADPIFGIFSHIGAVGLNGVHDGRIRIGETVAVFGLGVLGDRAGGAAVRCARDRMIAPGAADIASTARTPRSTQMARQRSRPDWRARRGRGLRGHRLDRSANEATARRRTRRAWRRWASSGRGAGCFWRGVPPQPINVVCSRSAGPIQSFNIAGASCAQQLRSA